MKLIDTLKNIIVLEQDSNDELVFPLEGSWRVSSHFGVRNPPTHGATRNHKGIDLAVPSGTPVRSLGDGRVTYAHENNDPDSKCGGNLQISYGEGLSSQFCHLRKIDVSVGERVSKGQVVGESGGGEGDDFRGTSTGPHLHFAIKRNQIYQDPENFFNAQTGEFLGYESIWDRAREEIRGIPEDLWDFKEDDEIKLGDEGQVIRDIKDILYELGYNPTNSDEYDQDLKDIIIDFQNLEGLDKTGIIDLQTVKKLRS